LGPRVNLYAKYKVFWVQGSIFVLSIKFFGSDGQFGPFDLKSWFDDSQIVFNFYLHFAAARGCFIHFLL